MNKNKLLLLISLLLSTQVQAQKPQKAAKEMFRQAVTAPSVPGISVAIADNSGLNWSKGFGFSDLENKVPMTRKTKLRIGSIAKVITSAGLMRLYEQGKVDLDANVGDLVSVWPEKHESISLNQLTSHTSGIRHYNSYAEFYANTEYASTQDALSIFKDDELLFSPGTGFRYTTFGWTLVSAVMEQAEGGKTFKDIMTEQVLTPLQMDNTTFDDNGPVISHRHRPYSYSGGQLMNSPEVNNSYKYAGGGFLSTPKDVVKFALAHSNPGYLADETLEKMFTKNQLSDGSTTDVGIGWFIGFETDLEWMKQDPQSDPELIRIMEEHPNTVQHSGGSVGGTSILLLCLDHERAVTVVKNVDGDESVNEFALALKTLDIFHQAH